MYASYVFWERTNTYTPIGEKNYIVHIWRLKDMRELALSFNMWDSATQHWQQVPLSSKPSWWLIPFLLSLDSHPIMTGNISFQTIMANGGNLEQAFPLPFPCSVHWELSADELLSSSAPPAPTQVKTLSHLSISHLRKFQPFSELSSPLCQDTDLHL